jgi:hypothetical protein
MEKRKRIILFGRTIILGTVGASLQNHLDFEIICLSAPYPSLQELAAMKPHVILFDMSKTYPLVAFSLLAIFPELQLISIDPSHNQLMVWTGQHFREPSLQDLVKVIQKEDLYTEPEKLTLDSKGA